MKEKSAVIRRAHPVDAHVGARVRARRKELRRTQAELGQAIGRTYQQVQNYENAADRISCSMLFEISRYLDVDVSWFFKEYEAEASPQSKVHPSEMKQAVSAYLGIKDPAVRLQVLKIMKTMSQEL